MATILEFTGQHAVPGSEDKADVDRGATAEIIFFPGIRIERYDIDPYLDDDLDIAMEEAVQTSKG